MVSGPPDEEAIFKIAASISSEETRSAYLQQVCGDNEPLLRRVQMLLRAHDESSGFLESPPLGIDTTIDQRISERPGMVIERYKLLEQIGEGGFGVVFMAEQEKPVRRKVALKIIKPGMDTSEVIARFEAERQALAIMDHPNIAKVLDAGATESGRPYFVMELVRGVPITEFCDQNNLSMRERLELFVSVCQAVQHAHQKGIIHRDIKPSNVLVTMHDDKPVPKVIDFGVAKATSTRLTERTLFTRFGQMVGTPLYMSPEQAQMSGLDVDTRSDVYSLGVLLYELLTGTTPLDQKRLREAAYDELLRIIREEEPPKPSTRLSTVDSLPALAGNRHSERKKRSTLVRGELDWIVMKALEKDRARRYESAFGFAEDVQHYLEGRPVAASPRSTMYRFRKLVWRNRIPVAVAALFLFAIITGGIIAGIGWMKTARLLDEQRHAWIDRAHAYALCGHVGPATEALEEARSLGEPRQLLDTIRGLALFYGGSQEEGIAVLENAIRDDENNLSAWSALLSTYLESANIMAWCEACQKFDTLDLTPSTPYEFLFYAQNERFVSAERQMAAIETLDRLLEKRERWGVAHAVRASLWAEYATTTQSMDHLHHAIQDANRARRLLPENPYVLTLALKIYTYAIELAGVKSPEERPRLTEQAAAIARKLAKYPDYALGTQVRSVFYGGVGAGMAEPGEFEALVSKIQQRPMIKLTELVETDYAAARDYLRSNQSLDVCDSFLGWVLALGGEREPAMDEYRQIMARSERDWKKQKHTIMIPMLLGDWAEGVKAARALRDSGLVETEQDKNVLRYFCGDISESELLLKAGPFSANKCEANFVIGIKSLAHGNKREALEAFQRAVETGAIGTASYHWSKAFVKRLRAASSGPSEEQTVR